MDFRKSLRECAQVEPASDPQFSGSLLLDTALFVLRIPNLTYVAKNTGSRCQLCHSHGSFDRLGNWVVAGDPMHYVSDSDQQQSQR